MSALLPFSRFPLNLISVFFLPLSPILLAWLKGSLRALTSGVTGHTHSFYQTLFYIPRKTATFDEAIQECAKINATLVSVISKEEQVSRIIKGVIYDESGCTD